MTTPSKSYGERVKASDKNRDLDLVEYLNGPAARRSEERKQLIVKLHRALLEVPTPDGCVTGCPVKQDRDNPHSLRCATVRDALEAVKQYRKEK